MVYWTLKSVPELAPLPRKERDRVHELCFRRHFLHADVTPRSITAFATFIFLASAIAAGGEGILQMFVFGNRFRFWTGMLFTGMGYTLAGYIFSRIAIPVLRPHYREFIPTQGTSDF
jgi:hypothetical protein